MKRQTINKTSVTIIAALILSCTLVQAGEFSFVPHGNIFRPLAANTFEPRMGFVIQGGENKLRLDIGNSADLVQYAADSLTVSFGADFFTYTYLRGEDDFHFPVDASDYLFGFSVNAVREHSVGTIAARLRLSHISAHFVDGHYNNYLGQWKDNHAPHVYSREFLELTAAFEPAVLNRELRAYAGGTYLFHVDPTELSRWSGVAGAEYHREALGNVNLFAAYQATFMKVIETKPRHDIHAGVKLGSWAGRGVKFYAAYFSGYNIHGEYYDEKISHTGFGMNVDF